MLFSFLWGLIGLLSILSVAILIYKFRRQNRVVSVCALVAGVLFFSFMARASEGVMVWIWWLYFGLLGAFWFWIESQDDKWW